MPPARRPASLLLAAGLLVSLSPSPARASNRFPDALQAGLGLGGTPECTLCHRTNGGGPNTVVKAFGKKLQSLGLEGRGNVTSLQAAILAADDENTDSDGDGARDLDELTLLADPNDAEDAPSETVTLSGTWFGGSDNSAIHATCTQHGAPPPSSLGAWLLPALVIAASRLRRRAQHAG